MFGVLISTVLLLLGALMSVAFYTILERKVLGLAQLRVGPSKVTISGLAQPVLDGVKLLTKPPQSPSFFSTPLVFVPPIVFFTSILGVWCLISLCNSAYSSSLGVLLFLVLLGIGAYITLLSGVGGVSKFSMLGAVRGSAQSISYEVVLTVLLISLVISRSSWSMSYMGFGVSLLLSPFLFICAVAESNRAPFDFSEGESELISGFNVEFGSGSFTLLFLGEYGAMLGVSFCLSAFVYWFLGPLFCVSLLLIRTVLPRFRYDMLMGFCWLSLLPLSCLFMLLFLFSSA